MGAGDHPLVLADLVGMPQVLASVMPSSQARTWGLSGGAAGRIGGLGETGHPGQHENSETQPVHGEPPWSLRCIG